MNAIITNVDYKSTDDSLQDYLGYLWGVDKMARKPEKRGSQSKLRLIKRCMEFIPKEQIKDLQTLIRGIYVLFQQEGTKEYRVRYIGLATRKIIERLQSHKRSRKRWTHFSIFEVWENIRDEEIQELEGLLRHIYRRDKSVQMYNKQHGYDRLLHVKCKLKDWKCYYWKRGIQYFLSKPRPK